MRRISWERSVFNGPHVGARQTVVVGVVSAGGLGRLLEQQRAAFDYPDATSVLALIAVSVAVDLVSAAARRSLR